MKNIQILDCTLRDGGRIINCDFEDKTIANMAKDLSKSGIDIVEMGFLRGKDLVKYEGNSTFFTEVSQIAPFIPKNRNSTMFVAFIDFGMYDFSDLEYCDGKSITGIRFGFTKKNLAENRDRIRREMQIIKERGYTLFVQGVNSLGYSDKEMLDLLDIINEAEPYSFGIVDTYGGMYLEDLIHYFSLVDYNLKPEICIDVHSHNNFQSSFAFSQEVVKMAEGKRNVILDATLNGMGKCAGNLNTELIADYLMRKKGGDYDIDIILDSIDRYLMPLKDTLEWGYSVPAFMAGITKSHPNNVIYLTDKFRLTSKDIKYILSAIDEQKRQRYDYDNIDRIYREYSAAKVDDSKTVDLLKENLSERDILVMVPGSTIREYSTKIENYIKEKSPVVISVNFTPKIAEPDYYFYANNIHWGKVSDELPRSKCIVTSNIQTDIDGAFVADYSSLLVENSRFYDNSTLMLLNLLKKAEVKNITLAGFDGLDDRDDNYVDNTFVNQHNLPISEINSEIKRAFTDYQKRVKGKIDVHLITPSKYGVV